MTKLQVVALMMISPGLAFSIYAVLFAYALTFVWPAIRRKSCRGAFQFSVIVRAGVWLLLPDAVRRWRSATGRSPQKLASNQ